MCVVVVFFFLAWHFSRTGTQTRTCTWPESSRNHWRALLVRDWLLLDLPVHDWLLRDWLLLALLVHGALLLLLLHDSLALLLLLLLLHDLREPLLLRDLWRQAHGARRQRRQ